MIRNERYRRHHAEDRDGPRFQGRNARPVRPWSRVCAAVAFVWLGAGCGVDGPAATGVKADGGGPDGASAVLVRGADMLDGAATIAVADTAVVLGGKDSSAGRGGSPNSGGNGIGGASGVAADGGIDAAIGVVPTATGCAPPSESKVCDPVCDTGCAALSRCDVTAEPHTGSCIGIWISGEGSLCLRTDITDPCASHLTCVDGACRRLCYRDSDCASPGTCCGQDLLLGGQSSGFKICVPCAH